MSMFDVGAAELRNSMGNSPNVEMQNFDANIQRIMEQEDENTPSPDPADQFILQSIAQIQEERQQAYQKDIEKQQM